MVISTKSIKLSELMDRLHFTIEDLRPEGLRLGPTSVLGGLGETLSSLGFSRTSSNSSHLHCLLQSCMS